MLKQLNQPAFRAGQVFSWLHKGVRSYEEMTNLPQVLRQTLEETRNAWQYEVALTEMAHQLSAHCAVSCHGEFPFLDVIRKGKVLRKADRYFRRNPIYRSNREVMGFWAEWMLTARMWLKRVLPKSVFNLLKKVLIKCGMTFYSPVK